MSMIEFSAVAKNFGATQVLHDINLKIEAGEVVVIIGPPARENRPCYAALTSWRRSLRERCWWRACILRIRTRMSVIFAAKPVWCFNSFICSASDRP